MPRKRGYGRGSRPYIQYAGKRGFTAAFGRSGGTFKRRRFNGRGRYRKSGFYGRYTGANAEMKFIDTTLVTDPIATNSLRFNLSTIPVGNGESERIGRKVVLKSMALRGRFQLNAGANPVLSSVNVRITLLQDTQTNGVGFGMTQWLEADQFAEYANLANTGRFKILEVQKFNLSRQAGAEVGGLGNFPETGRWYECFKKFNIPMEYDNVDGDVTTQRTNSLWWVVQVDSVGISAFSLKTRLRYTDR